MSTTKAPINQRETKIEGSNPKPKKKKKKKIPQIPSP
jgi:hypothetical protein